MVNGKTLNLTLELERLIADITARIDEFRHVDPSRVMVCVATTRGGGVHGTYAKIHPLRFENGSRTTLVKRRRSSVRCEVTPVSRQGVEMLYVIYVLVPRFLNLPLREKLITVFHELYHVSPAFDGDIRRFPGKNYAHGSSRKKLQCTHGTDGGPVSGTAGKCQQGELSGGGYGGDASPVRFACGEKDGGAETQDHT